MDENVELIVFLRDRVSSINIILFGDKRWLVGWLYFFIWTW